MSESCERFDPYHKWLGIAPGQQPPHHYRLLGIELFEDDPEVIAAAADRQMAHVRTFQSGPHTAWSQRILNELAAARLCLLDPARKREYDAQLRARLQAEDQWGEAALAAAPGSGPADETAPTGLSPSWLRLLPQALRYLRVEAERLWLQHSRLPGLYWQVGLARYHEGRYDPHLADLPPLAQAVLAEAEPPARRRRNPWRTLGRLWRAGLEHRRRAAALQRLGRQACAQQGPGCAGPALAESLRNHLARLSACRSELERLARIPPGHALSPRRLAWLLLMGLAGSATLFWNWARPW